MQMKKPTSSSIAGISVSFLVLFIGAGIIIMNYFIVMKGNYKDNIKHDALDIYYKFSLSDNKIRSDVSSVFQNNISSIYDPQQSYGLCKDMAKKSPYIRCVYFEYTPDFFQGMHAFCPYYDAASDTFKNLADSTVFGHDYLKDDALFKRIYENNEEEPPTVSSGDDFLRVDGHRLMIRLVDKNKGKMFVVINVLLSPEYSKDICSSITSWKSSDSLITFNSKNGDVMHNTFSSNPGNMLSYLQSLDDKTLEESLMHMLQSRKDTACIIYYDDSSAWTFVHDSTLNTGMICQTGYRFMTEKFIRLLAIICTFIFSVIIVLVTGIVQTKKALEVNKRMGMTEKDFLIAAKLQKSMLPIPDKDVPQISIDSRIIPVKEIGGDFYYFTVRNNYLHFCIGDVSGKGLPASLFMSKAISLFACISRYAFRADDIAEQLNQELCQNNDNCMFVTMFIGILNMKTGELQYCNAGHDEPVFWNGKDSALPYYLSTSDNIPLGVEKDLQFTQGTMWLKAGASLFLYTDGVTEAKRKDLAMYGEERLVQCISKNLHTADTTFCGVVLDDVSAFVNGNEQSDDITMLSITIKHIDSNITLTNDITELRKLPGFFDNISKVLAYPEEELIKIRVAIDEVMTNCILYAYPHEKNKEISLHAKTADGQLIFTVTDQGMPFNPLKNEDSSLDDIGNTDIEEMKIGGLGIPLMKATFNNVEYQRIENNNVLVLTKNL